MPVTTRSQTQTASARQNAKPLPRRQPSKTIIKASCTIAPENHIQNSVFCKTPRRAKRKLLSSQRPQEQLSTAQALQRKYQSLTATDLSPEPCTSTLKNWACSFCPCPQGVYYFPVDSCIRCGHTMDDHEDVNHRWNSECDFACQRSNLVYFILQLVRTTRVVVIRATPQVGKTTLLRLLGRHILEKEKDLEPVFICWDRKDLRDNLPYQQYLEQEKSKWQEYNEKYRPRNPKATTVYLIDEAQDSYEEEQLWTQTLKSHNTRQKPMFVLVCLYGVIGTSRMREPGIESRALLMDYLQRIELRQSVPGRPYMLFKPDETTDTVQKWAILNNLQIDTDISEYLHTATDGHPGMVGVILKYLKIISDQVISI